MSEPVPYQVRLRQHVTDRGTLSVWERMVPGAVANAVVFEWLAIEALTPDLLERVLAWTRDAHARRAGVYQDLVVLWPGDEDRVLEEVARAALNVANHLFRDYGYGPDVVLDWLRIALDAGTEDAWVTAYGFLTGRCYLEGVLVPGSLEDWVARLPVGAGSAAWAAGLSVEEAETRAAVGTLDLGGLRVLAALRGYQVPEVEAVAVGLG